MSNTEGLKSLGSKKTAYLTDKPRPELLEVFENAHQDNLYVAPFECFEGSSLCPKTGQPDIFTLYINYIPDKKCVESKSLKLYIFSYRNTGSFMEDITNKIAKDLFQLLEPHYIEVYADFNSRGGIYLRPFVRFYGQTADYREVDLLLSRYSFVSEKRKS